MGTLLNRSQIFAAPTMTKDVEVHEWGGSVRVRAMTPRTRVQLLDAINANAREVEDYEADQALELEDRQGLPKVEYLDQTILTLITCIVDEKGKPLFTMADYPQFLDLGYATLGRVWTAIRDLDAPLDTDALKKTSA